MAPKSGRTGGSYDQTEVIDYIYMEEPIKDKSLLFSMKSCQSRSLIYRVLSNRRSHLRKSHQQNSNSHLLPKIRPTHRVLSPNKSFESRKAKNKTVQQIPHQANQWAIPHKDFLPIPYSWEAHVLLTSLGVRIYINVFILPPFRHKGSVPILITDLSNHDERHCV